MNGNNNQYNNQYANYSTSVEPPQNYPKENVFLGVLGAFLFSLAGGILWYVLYQIGILAAISGFVGTFAAIYGYFIFSKNESMKGIVIGVIFSLLTLVLAWYLCIATDVFNVYKEWYAMGEIDYQITFGEALQSVPLFMTEPEIAFNYWKDLVIGIIFAVAGSIKPVLSFKDII
ncbi:MAG: hypothetical protein U0O22_09535 [Acutalibacteraceae bacterium]